VSSWNNGILARPGATSTVAYKMPPYPVGSDFTSDRQYVRSGPGNDGLTFTAYSFLFYDSNVTSFLAGMQSLATIQVSKTSIKFRNLEAFNPYQKNKEKHFQFFLRITRNDAMVSGGLGGVRQVGEELLLKEFCAVWEQMR